MSDVLKRSQLSQVRFPVKQFIVLGLLLISAAAQGAVVQLKTAPNQYVAYDVSSASLEIGRVNIYIKGSLKPVCAVTSTFLANGAVNGLQLAMELNTGSAFDYVVECESDGQTMAATRIRPRLAP